MQNLTEQSPNMFRVLPRLLFASVEAESVFLLVNPQTTTGNVTQFLVKTTSNIYLVRLFPLTGGIKHFRSIKQISIYYAVVHIVELTQRKQSGF